MNNKTLRIVIDLLLIIIGIVFLIFGIKDFITTIKNNKVEDSMRFQKNFSYVSDDNNYKYISLEELYKKLDKSGVVLIGSYLDSWTQVLVSPLNDIASKHGEIIYYLETEELDDSSKYYKRVLSKLELENFFVPTLIFINNGDIEKIFKKGDIYGENYKEAPIEYWTNNRLEEFKNKIDKEFGNID